MTLLRENNNTIENNNVQTMFDIIELRNFSNRSLALSAWSNAGVNPGIVMGTELTELTENIAFSVR